MILISCSSDETSEWQEILVHVSPKNSAYFAETDLSSNYPFPSPTFLDDTIMLSYNMIRKAIDTLYIDGDSLWIKKGHYLQNDGPRKVESVNNIVNTQSGLVIFNAKNIMIDTDGKSAIENHRLSTYSLFGEDAFYGLAHGVSFNLDNVFKAYDRGRDCLYFFAKNFQNEEFKLVSFELKTRNFVEFPMWADIELVRKNKSSYKEVSKNHMPFIFVHENYLVISYHYSNEFVVVDLNTREVHQKTHPSDLFPLNKTAQIFINEDLDLQVHEEFYKVLELLDQWDKDVAFGNFERLPNRKGFFRMVKSPQSDISKIEQLNLEVFDSFFKKVGELNLTEVQEDLSTDFFTYGDRIFFKAKQQDHEDYLNYYFVEVDF